MVHQDHYKDFLESVALFVDQMFGDSKDDFLNSNSYARIISSRHFDRLRLLLEEAIEWVANL